MVLQIYMARDGLARFCTVPYQHPNNRNIHSAYMHLTNYSLNKRSRNYLHTESEVTSVTPAAVVMVAAVTAATAAVAAALFFMGADEILTAGGGDANTQNS